jgi:hypothetical protein
MGGLSAAGRWLGWEGKKARDKGRGLRGMITLWGG